MFKKLILFLILSSYVNIFGQDTKPPNIIMMIGDGMGLSAISSGMYSNNNYTSLERSESKERLRTITPAPHRRRTIRRPSNDLYPTDTIAHAQGTLSLF